MNMVANVMDDIQEFPQMSLEVATMPTFLGGIGGIVVGAMVGGFLSSVLSFSGRLADMAGAAGEFLIGAGLYGYGLSGRVGHPALRSATQVTGVVVAGMGLGRLLSQFGGPTFGLGSEISEDMALNGYLVGQDFEGRATGQWVGAAQEEGLPSDETQSGPASAAMVGYVGTGEWGDRNVIGQGFEGNVVGQAEEEDDFATDGSSHDWTPNTFKPGQMSGPQDPSSPEYSTSRVRPFENKMLPWQMAETADIMAPSSPMGGVDQWYGSAESQSVFGNGTNFVRTANSGYVGNMVVAAEGLGSIVGQ